MPTQVYYSEIVNLIVIFVNKYNRLKATTVSPYRYLLLLRGQLALATVDTAVRYRAVAASRRPRPPRRRLDPGSAAPSGCLPLLLHTHAAGLLHRGRAVLHRGRGPPAGPPYPYRQRPGVSRSPSFPAELQPPAAGQ
jgi:hypothetical protein